MEIHHLPALRDEGKAYFEFLRTRNLSVGVYRLSAGGTDSQQPHGEEEIYFVVSGRARFSSGTQDVAVNAGDILFFPPREPHRFHEIAESLELLVFFAPAEGTQ
jgi:mannose-6-phosphate isomerase-like protein (cupin superfamily)